MRIRFGRARTGWLLLRAAAASSAVLIVVAPLPAGGGEVPPTAATGFDLDVDSDRDGEVEEEEDATEEDAGPGSGAVIAPNLDDDDRDGRQDAVSFGRAGHVTEDNVIVEDGDDDLSTLEVETPGTDANRVYLTADEQDVRAFHLFDSSAPGSTSVWGGPGEARTVLDITELIDATPGGRSTFAIEALFFEHDVPGAYGVFPRGFDGVITLGLLVGEGSERVVADEVRISVAPFLLIPNTQPAVELWAARGSGNVGFLHQISSSLGTTKLRTYPEGDDGDIWTQDHVEIGYTEAPGAPRTYVALRFSRRPFPRWPERNLLGPDLGLFSVATGTTDSGGNLELLPPTEEDPLGRVIAGTTMGSALFSFFKDQEVQDPIRLDTHWLSVGHVDEVLGVGGRVADGTIIVNSPALGACLLGAPGTGRGCGEDVARHSVLFAADGSDPDKRAQVAEGHVVQRADPSELLVGGITSGLQNYRFVRIYEGKGAGQTARIALTSGDRITVERVWNTGPAMDPKWDSRRGCTSSRCPPRRFMRSRRDWFVRPDDSSRIVLMEATKAWPGLFLFERVPSAITVAELRLDRSLWRVNRLAQARIDRAIADLEAAVGERLRVTRVPALFVARTAGGGALVDRSGLSFIPNLANVQPAGGRVFVADPHGPTGGDPLSAWVRTHVRGARLVETWAPYHRNDGEAHCATYAKRALPATRWWVNPS